MLPNTHSNSINGLFIPNLEIFSAYGIIRGMRSCSNRIYSSCKPGYKTPLSSKYIEEVFKFDSYSVKKFENSIFKIDSYKETDENFITTVIKNCKENNIEVIYPNNDELLYVLSKNNDVFTKNNITVISASHDSLVTCLDKALCFQKLQNLGFHKLAPKTLVNINNNNYDDIVKEIGSPFIVKKRVGGGSISVYKINDKNEFDELCLHVDIFSGNFIFQEYIPGSIERSINILIDKEGNSQSFILRKARYINPSQSTSIEVLPVKKELNKEIASFLHMIKFHGFAAIQAKLDERTNTYKIIEINPRFGNNSRILFELGYNFPLARYKIFHDSAIEKIKFNRKVGVCLVSDYLVFRKFIKNKYFGKKHQSNDLPPFYKMAWSYIRIYGQFPAIDYCTKAFLRGDFIYGKFMFKLNHFFYKYWRDREEVGKLDTAWGDL